MRSAKKVGERISRRPYFCAVLVSMLAGCSFIPSTGPSRQDVDREYAQGAQGAQDHPFRLVDITQQTIEKLKQRVEPSFAQFAGSDDHVPELYIGAGDGVTVTVWETGSVPLFAPMSLIAGSSGAITNSPGAHGTVLPEQTVGPDGTISIPFAGNLMVRGTTPLQAQRIIEEALRGKTASPQVIVNLSRNASNTVSVIGEGSGGARIPLSVHGERILDLLAASGGPRQVIFESWLSLTRNGANISVPLEQVFGNPRENIYVRPGDVIVLTRRPETFTVFGATGRNAQINFDAREVNLLEAIAKAGGLNDSRADPRGVFLFRTEDRVPADAVAIPGANPGESATRAEHIPVAYRLNLTRAHDYFLARNFQVRNGDVIYVSNAPANQVEKVLRLLGSLTQPAVEGTILGNSIK